MKKNQNFKGRTSSLKEKIKNRELNKLSRMIKYHSMVVKSLEIYKGIFKEEINSILKKKKVKYDVKKHTIFWFRLRNNRTSSEIFDYVTSIESDGYAMTLGKKAVKLSKKIKRKKSRLIRDYLILNDEQYVPNDEINEHKIVFDNKIVELDKKYTDYFLYIDSLLSQHTDIRRKLRNNILASFKNDSKETAWFRRKKTNIDNAISIFNERIDAKYASKYLKTINKIENKIKSRKLKLDKFTNKINALISEQSSEYNLEEDVVLKVENLSLTLYGNKLLDNVSFSVKRGEIVGISGPDGAGKSLLCRVISGEFKPDSGNILFRNQFNQVVKLDKLSPYRIKVNGIENNYLRKHHKPYHTLLDSLKSVARVDVWETTRLFLNPPLLKIMIKTQAYELIAALNEFAIIDYRDEFLYFLPYLPLKTYGFMRMLVTNPSFLLLDEAKINIEEARVKNIIGPLYKSKNKRGFAALFVLQDENIATRVCSKVIMMNKGKIEKIMTGVEEW